MTFLIDLSWFTWITLISVLPLIYWRLTRNFDYWTKRGITGPKPYPSVGTNLYHFFTPMTTVDTQRIRIFGKIYGLFNGNVPVLSVAAPELIQKILVKDFHLFVDRKTRPYSHPVLTKNVFHSRADHWKRLRTIVSPTFTSGKMRKMYPMVRECVAEYLQVLDGYARHGLDVNIKDMHYKLTMNVIARCAFATKTDTYGDPNNPFIRHVKSMTHFPFLKLLLMYTLPAPVKKVLGIKYVGSEESNEFFMGLTHQIVTQRKTDPDAHRKYSDFIQLLVDAEVDRDAGDDQSDDEAMDADEAHHVNEGKEEREVQRKPLATNIANKKLTTDEIKAQGWIFFIAGSETAATTLAYSSYELALNPDIQERLRAEVDGAVDADGEFPYERLTKLPLLDAVIAETLRLYPPSLRIDRKCSQDYKLGESGITLFKGQDVDIPVYAIHHSSDFYENPEQFNPDRFMPHNRHKLTPYTYLPFGAGPRNCVGMRFALLEIKLSLVHIIRRYRFVRSAQTPVPLEFKTVANVCSAKRVVVAIHER